MRKFSKTETDLKKSVSYKKKRVSLDLDKVDVKDNTKLLSCDLTVSLCYNTFIK